MASAGMCTTSSSTSLHSSLTFLPRTPLCHLKSRYPSWTARRQRCTAVVPSASQFTSNPYGPRTGGFLFSYIHLPSFREVIRQIKAGAPFQSACWGPRGTYFMRHWERRRVIILKASGFFVMLCPLYHICILLQAVIPA